MSGYAEARGQMVERQLRRRGIGDRRVLDAMLAVPREAFVEIGDEEFAYEDRALPIAEGQTISQPYIVGLMAAAAEIERRARVLEVGGGSGYAAAVLSRIAREVFVVERRLPLVERARERWACLGYRNLKIRHGDGTKGWPEAAPFNAIVVAAYGPELPPALKQQLAIGGVLVMPVGAAPAQQLSRTRRIGADQYATEDLAAVSFVPLIGEEGWAEDGDDRRCLT